MKPATFLLTSCTAAAAAAVAVPPPSSSSSSSSNTRIPTSYESAVLARRILALTPLGTLATIFPSNSPSTAEDRPSSVAGMPHSLMDYISDCEPVSTGNPTLLALSIETTFKNTAAGSNLSIAVQWTPPHPPPRSLLSSLATYFTSASPPLRYSPAALPRFSLLGYVEPIPNGDDRTPGAPGAALAKCFTSSHPDARYWLPGNRIHESHFVRLVVEQVYWIGGFGDRAFIGWIPVDEWRSVTEEEWQAVRLPGEEEGALLGDL
ncbi:pyridoxamine 5'-phosphate oxidase-domain-containing protein [Lasiosphaeris hirsuta]|uniref:Pyridoxamine 5'-phosphate oxidase-domain-containing protein n=1 Tax=Lasiosphaeris hirsuta TaxID=260670 RepID=A0AA40B8Z9_9PEZI|nr:pyridoxamine 5'-phosphate oxidase-domain-containing protein [Lasiosphaeris hirsuta]